MKPEGPRSKLNFYHRLHNMLNRLITLAISSPLIRRILLWIRFREFANFGLRLVPIRRKVPGNESIVYRVNTLDNLLVAREIFVEGEYRHLENLPQVETFVDLGCNCGYFPLFLASFVPAYRLRGLCIDANPQMVEDTWWHLKANGLSHVQAAWGLVGAAGLGKKSAFYVNADAAGSSQFDVTPTGHLSKKNLERIEVPVLDLQALWKSTHGEVPCDVLKIDIEGSEGHFLDQELDFVKRCKYVVIEIHRWLVQPDAVRQRLESVGLRLTKVIGNEQDAEVHIYVRDGLVRELHPGVDGMR